MPFKSEKQRRYLWVHEPKIAHAWAHGEHTSSAGRLKDAKGKPRSKSPNSLEGLTRAGRQTPS